MQAAWQAHSYMLGTVCICWQIARGEFQTSLLVWSSQKYMLDRTLSGDFWISSQIFLKFKWPIQDPEGGKAYLLPK